MEEKEENEEMMHSSVQRENQENLNEFKMNLMSKLGGTPSKTQDLNRKDSMDKRSRLNSLRNGETSKVLQTHNIDIPIIDKE